MHMKQFHHSVLTSLVLICGKLLAPGCENLSLIFYQLVIKTLLFFNNGRRATNFLWLHHTSTYILIQLFTIGIANDDISLFLLDAKKVQMLILLIFRRFLWLLIFWCYFCLWWVEKGRGDIIIDACFIFFKNAFLADVVLI